MAQVPRIWATQWSPEAGTGVAPFIDVSHVHSQHSCCCGTEEHGGFLRQPISKDMDPPPGQKHTVNSPGSLHGFSKPEKALLPPSEVQRWLQLLRPPFHKDTRQSRHSALSGSLLPPAASSQPCGTADARHHVQLSVWVPQTEHRPPGLSGILCHPRPICPCPYVRPCLRPCS